MQAASASFGKEATNADEDEEDGACEEDVVWEGGKTEYEKVMTSPEQAEVQKETIDPEASSGEFLTKGTVLVWFELDLLNWPVKKKVE